MRRNTFEIESLESAALRAVGMDRLLGSERDRLSDLRDQAAHAERHGPRWTSSPDAALIDAIRSGRYR
ncbi:MAG: hypothetical protein U1A78_41125 [Polyangia bacterium]